MKKLLILGLSFGTAAAALTGCNGSDGDGKGLGTDSVFYFTHQDGHDTEREFEAHIVWQNDAGAYTQFQIGYTSCICRDDATKNHRNFIYFELNENTLKIQNAEFHHYADSEWTANNLSDGQGNDMEEKMQGYLDTYINGKTKDEIAKFDRLSGFGDAQEVVSGATVTAVNLPRMLIGFYDHWDKVLSKKT